MANLLRVTSFSLDIDDWYSCQASDDEAGQAAMERNSVMNIYTVPGAPSPSNSPRVGEAGDAAEGPPPEAGSDPRRLHHDHPEVDMTEAPALKRTRSSATGLSPLPPLASSATPSFKARQPARQSGHRRPPQHSATDTPNSAAPSDAPCQVSGLPSVPEPSLRVFLTVRPDDSYVHVNVLPAVFCFGNVTFPAARHLSISNDFASTTTKDQSKGRLVEGGKDRKQGGFPGAFLFQRIFSGLRASIGGGAKAAETPLPASAQELASELLQAAKPAALARFAMAAQGTFVAGYVQAVPDPAAPIANNPNVGEGAVATPVRSSVGVAALASPAKSAPSPRDTAFLPPQLELPERDQAPSAHAASDASAGADVSRQPATSPPRQSASSCSSPQHSLGSASQTSGIAAMALLAGLATDAGAGSPGPKKHQQATATTLPGAPVPILVAQLAEVGALAVDTQAGLDAAVDDDDLPTPTLEKCDSPVLTPTTAAANAFAAAVAAASAGASSTGDGSTADAGIAPVSAIPRDTIAAGTIASPGTATKKAYGTVANLVKKIAPGFKDSSAASMAVNSPPRVPQQLRPHASPSHEAASVHSEPSPAARSGDHAQQVDGAGLGEISSSQVVLAEIPDASAAVPLAAGAPLAGVVPAASPLPLAGFTHGTAAGEVTTTADVGASPRAATRAAYGTLANLVKKMVPGFKDSVAASIAVNSPPADRLSTSPQPSAPFVEAVSSGSPADGTCNCPQPAGSPRAATSSSSDALVAEGTAALASSPTAETVVGNSAGAATMPLGTGTVAAAQAGNTTTPTSKDTASPGAASRAAYGTLAHLVKKMVPGFKDSVAASIAVSNSPRCDGQLPSAADPADGRGQVEALSADEQTQQQGHVALPAQAEKNDTAAGIGETAAQEPGHDGIIEAPESPGSQRSPAMFIFGQEKPKSGRRLAPKPLRAAATSPNGRDALAQGDLDGRKRKGDNMSLPSAKIPSSHSKASAVGFQLPVVPQPELTAVSMASLPSPEAAVVSTGALQAANGALPDGQEAAPAGAAAELVGAVTAIEEGGSGVQEAAMPQKTPASEPEERSESAAAQPKETTRSVPRALSVDDKAAATPPSVAQPQPQAPAASAPGLPSMIDAVPSPKPKGGKAKKGGLFACFSCFGAP